MAAAVLAVASSPRAASGLTQEQALVAKLRVHVAGLRAKKCLEPHRIATPIRRVIDLDRIRAQWQARHVTSHAARARVCTGLTYGRYLRIPSWRRGAWQAIHSCEGPWADANDPYWGGLQMDRSFMASYGADAIRKFGGFANVWPWWAQVIVADRAYMRGRGFYPWPACARRAGLI